jgi:hypothetical protein
MQLWNEADAGVTRVEMPTTANPRATLSSDAGLSCATSMKRHTDDPPRVGSLFKRDVRRGNAPVLSHEHRAAVGAPVQNAFAGFNSQHGRGRGSIE